VGRAEHDHPDPGSLLGELVQGTGRRAPAQRQRFRRHRRGAERRLDLGGQPLRVGVRRPLADPGHGQPRPGGTRQELAEPQRLPPALGAVEPDDDLIEPWIRHQRGLSAPWGSWRMRRLPAHRAGHSFMLNFMQVR
jgi:hypothetical protein